MKKTGKVKATVRRLRRRVRDLETACFYLSKEIRRLNGIIFDDEVSKDLYDYARGL